MKRYVPWVQKYQELMNAIKGEGRSESDLNKLCGGERGLEEREFKERTAVRRKGERD